MKEDWTKDIQKLMDGYEVEPPQGLLDDVKSRLHTPPVAQAEGEKPRTVVMTPLRRYRWVAAAAVVAAIVAPLTWKHFQQQQVPTALVAQSTQGTVGGGTPDVGLAGGQAGSDATDGMGAIEAMDAIDVVDKTKWTGRGTNGSGYADTYAQSETTTSSLSVGTALAAGENESYINNKDNGKEDISATGSEKRKDNSSTVNRNRKESKNDNRINDAFVSPTSHDSGRGLTLTAYYGGGTGGNGSASAGNMYVMSDANPFGSYNLDMAGSNSEGFVGANKHEKKASHAQPVKVGVSVGYRLNNRWSVNTGVTYSYLSSDFTEESMPTVKQRLHYVGVPVTGSFSIVRGKRAEVYVTAGGEVEKLVKGSNSDTRDGSDKVTEKRPQWSVKAAVGGAYHFTPGISIYAEPGVSHHFDNHSSVVNVYKDRPTSFSLNIGLRIEP